MQTQSHKLQEHCQLPSWVINFILSINFQGLGKNCSAVGKKDRKNETAKENETVMITLKIILLTITFAAMSKDIFQV
jgi:heme/copper-type cytochrome/quinol oxidase subunit 4